MSDIIEIKGDDTAQWDSFVSSHKLGCIYHTSAWRSVIEKAFGHRPLYLAVKNRDGNIWGGLPFFEIKSKLFGNRLSSLPCAQHCNPLVSSEQEYGSLLEFSMDYMKRNNLEYIELKTDETFKQNNGRFSEDQHNYSYYTLDLDNDLRAMEASFHFVGGHQAISGPRLQGI